MEKKLLIAVERLIGDTCFVGTSAPNVESMIANVIIILEPVQ